ncbi:MAG: helicase-related protein [Acidimicrobiia bacterium]|nr:helicase-related protein [Acidimicrobiia bacterium]
MLVYGDLDKSELREMPPGRTPIMTSVVGPDPMQRESAYRLLRDEVAAGRQAYVVCPLVEGSPKIEAKAVTEEYERLAAEDLEGLRLGLLHGQMPSREKEAVMAAFRDGEIDALVATTVIEVGVDVTNATVMIIEDADRFGLSQLHQLRGRVGRGAATSHCFLFAARALPTPRRVWRRWRSRPTASPSPSGTSRSEDRGGVRRPSVGFQRPEDGPYPRDEGLVVEARRVAEGLLDLDGDLTRHAGLRQEVEDLLGDDVEFLFKA